MSYGTKYSCSFFLLMSWIFLSNTSWAQDMRPLSYPRYVFGYTFTENPPISGTALLYKNSSNRLGEVDIPILPPAIKQLVLSKATFNPFKGAYAYLYSPQNQKKLSSCYFAGLPFELDDNPKTQEWVASVSLYGCLAGQSSGNGADAHSWILQQDAQKRTRVLMESDGDVIVKEKTPQDKFGYRQIWTEHYVTRFAPQDKLGCGRVEMKWIYQGKQYKILQQGPTISVDCDGDRWNENLSDAENRQRKHQAAMQVKAVVNRWLPTLKAFR